VDPGAPKRSYQTTIAFWHYFCAHMTAATDAPEVEATLRAAGDGSLGEKRFSGRRSDTRVEGCLEAGFNGFDVLASNQVLDQPDRASDVARERVNLRGKRARCGSPRPVRVYSHGRVCRAQECDTLLSIYNGSEFCWVHAAVSFRHV
jgi:hypothetical protein